MRNHSLFLMLPIALAAIAVSFCYSVRRDLPPEAASPSSGSVYQSEMSAPDSSTRLHIAYDGVLNGSKPLTAKERSAIATTAEMPATACESVEIVHNEIAKHAHRTTIDLFTTASGFGFVRMWVVRNSRGIQTGAREIDRAELVSLLEDEQPAAYVLDEMATPPKARVARRRRLDEFEERGLEAVRRGADLVWSPATPKRMFGAVRAQNECIDCHPGSREGDLLGAFSYFLTMPVDSLQR
jgi:hypothetical protein